ncbi:MBL fold metallo-hydrolase [Winogradskyella alexanderae]|uniref:MBL fold metallo-hydrolase n=1 Tax=Winogradskyella alexanderae TaxID=2877123 RepID=A0ABS7XS99_9FLAO|nr:MBL fold metallo-hydrolase [Winogradskyella alexanderae]MCA0132645.1 MBL fold metallo-hydrolase [Winogradskyella alexanderae]
MKILRLSLFLLSISLLSSCSETKSKQITEKINQDAQNADPVTVKPIKHGTLVIETKDLTIYVDPTGGKEAFAGQQKPTHVLITDIHGDHLNMETLESIELSEATLIGPKAVTDKIPSTIAPKVVTLPNGESFKDESVSIEAIPMYNLRAEALKFHEKGRGNGYVVSLEGQRIYISGDTEDIPEMRNLENIDKAFVCMNLPYTMPIESAASAVLDFEPKTVYPYHYRGTNGLSDIAKFKSLVNEKNDKIEVKLLKWYGN